MTWLDQELQFWDPEHPEYRRLMDDLHVEISDALNRPRPSADEVLSAGVAFIMGKTA